MVEVISYLLVIFPGGASGKEPACQCRRRKRLRFDLGREDPLEEDMATHSSILDWRIPWREEPGGLQSMTTQRVGHNWSYLACVQVWDDTLLSKHDRVERQVQATSLSWASICPQWDSDIHPAVCCGDCIMVKSQDSWLQISILLLPSWVV